MCPSFVADKKRIRKEDDGGWRIHVGIDSNFLRALVPKLRLETHLREAPIGMAHSSREKCSASTNAWRLPFVRSPLMIAGIIASETSKSGRQCQKHSVKYSRYTRRARFSLVSFTTLGASDFICFSLP